MSDLPKWVTEAIGNMWAITDGPNFCPQSAEFGAHLVLEKLAATAEGDPKGKNMVPFTNGRASVRKEVLGD